MRRCENSCSGISPPRLFWIWQHSITEKVRNEAAFVLSRLTNLQANKNTPYPTRFLLWSALKNTAGKNGHLFPTLVKHCSHNGFCCTDIYQIILTVSGFKKREKGLSNVQLLALCLQNIWRCHFRLKRIIICNSFGKAQKDFQRLRWGVNLKGHKSPLWEYPVQFLAPHLSNVLAEVMLKMWQEPLQTTDWLEGIGFYFFESSLVKAKARTYGVQHTHTHKKNRHI